MKNYISAAVFVLALGASSFAYAQVTTQPPNNGATNTVVVPPNTTGGTGTTQTAAAPVDPTADTNASGQTDYRLSCPYLSATPTVDTCRTLYKPPSTLPY